MMFLKTSENLFKNCTLRSCKIYFSSRISMASSFKKDYRKIKIEKSIRGQMSHAVYQYASKYMKDNEKKESSYLKYWDVNNLCGGQCQKSFH